MKAIALWRSICDDQNQALSVIDVDSLMGRRIKDRLGLKALPAVLFDDRLVAVGVQSMDQALELLNSSGTDGSV
jgi:hypothetical protein